jgi:NADH:ubiquinone oxidoreductase subunit 3 (subunit A)
MSLPTDLMLPSPVQTLGLTDMQVGYICILILLLMAITFAIANVFASLVIGPRRDGAVKSDTYESGMQPIGTAGKRFNVRFYIIAMAFLVFDVEIIFLYPWAVTYANLDETSAYNAVFLGRVLFFFLTTVVMYIYGYRKGVFRFD